MTDLDEAKKANIHTKDITAIHELDALTFPTVHIDKAMVGIDSTTNMATLTLLSQHIIPKLDGQGWGLSNVKWKVEAEIKIPVPALNALVVYYITQVANGLNIMPIISKYLSEHPPPAIPKQGMFYGPLSFGQENKEGGKE